MTEKFIPYEKLSKKQKKEMDKKRRQTWGDMSPVTRRAENSKAYNRKKLQRTGWDDPGTAVFLCA